MRWIDCLEKVEPTLNPGIKLNQSSGFARPIRYARRQASDASFPKAPPVTSSPEDLDAPLAIDKAVLQRRVPLQQRGQQTLDQILQAAAQVIDAEGLDRLTTKRIAVEAGLSVGTVYEYFPNKEAVLSALVGQWFDRVMQALDAHHPRATGTRDILRYLEESIGAVRQIYVEQPALGAMLSALQAIPALRGQVEQHDQRVIDNMVGALGMLVPHVPADDLGVVSRSIVLITHELITESLVRDAAHAAQIATHMRVCLFALASHLLIAR